MAAEWHRIGSSSKFATVVVVLISLLLASLIPSALSYMNGAPSDACSTLTPNHQGAAGQDESTLPYRINTDVFQDANSGALLYAPGFVYNGNPLVCRLLYYIICQ